MYINLDNDLGDYENVGYRSYDYDYNQQLPATQQQQQQQLEDYDYNQQLPANQQQQQQLDDYDYPEEPLAVPNSQISDIQRPPLSRHESQVNIISNFHLIEIER